MDADEALLRAAREAIAYRELVEKGSEAEIATFAQELALFDAPLPEQPTNPEQVIEELVSKASPGLRSMTSPTFFGWVIGGSHPAGVAADWLTSAWGQNAGNFAAARAAAEERGDMTGLPRTIGRQVAPGARHRQKSQQIPLFSQSP